MSAGIRSNTTDAALQFNGTDVAVFDADGIQSTGISYLPAGTGAVATDVQSKLREFVSVKDFGADPTGTLDSTAAIVAALSTGYDVKIPAGTYRLSPSSLICPVADTFVAAGNLGV